jgi:hypothetical protein
MYITDVDAISLAEVLDGLPLALATAGAYLDQAPATSLSDYLRLYKASWLKLQLASASGSELLMSVSRDSTVKLWNADSGS